MLTSNAAPDKVASHRIAGFSDAGGAPETSPVPALGNPDVMSPAATRSAPVNPPPKCASQSMPGLKEYMALMRTGVHARPRCDADSCVGNLPRGHVTSTAPATMRPQMPPEAPTLIVSGRSMVTRLPPNPDTT